MGNVLYKFKVKVSTLLKFYFQITVAITNVTFSDKTRRKSREAFLRNTLGT